MSEFLGMHWTLALFLISIIMLIVDFFVFNGGVLTFIAGIFVTFVLLHFVPSDNIIILAFVGIFVYAGILMLHLFFYRKLAVYLMDRFLAPQKAKSNNDLLVGKIGKICWIEDRAYIYVDDEHIPCEFEGAFSQEEDVGKKAKVVCWNQNGTLVVTVVR